MFDRLKVEFNMLDVALYTWSARIQFAACFDSLIAFSFNCLNIFSSKILYDFIALYVQWF